MLQEDAFQFWRWSHSRWQPFLAEMAELFI